MKLDEVNHPLKHRIGELPLLPGIYIMRDGEGEVIYVGKAKNLRVRVRSYFTGGDEREQIEYLLKRIASIDTIVTETEHQAFVLERDLITKHKPRYNIKLKDDKSYLTVRIDQRTQWPRLELVRRQFDDGAKYFGPYVFSDKLREALEAIKRVVPLRSCSDTVFANRQRPCLEYQIKRCCGPCTLPVLPEEYAGYVKQAIGILQGKNEEVIRDLSKQMTIASEDLRFEDAAVIRDRIDALQKIGEERHIVTHGGENRDVVGFYRENDLIQLTMLNIRGGRILSTVHFGLTGVKIASSDVLEAALQQYYDSDRDIPEEIVTPFLPSNPELIESVLGERRGAVVSLHVPQKGIKFRLLGLALVNAKQQFTTAFDVESRNAETMKALARLFSLSQIPRRIECVDISNLQGSNIVAGIVSFFDGVPDKSAYKKYKVHREDTPDDFASIYEVVGRRLARGLEDNDLPDLMVIDGGLGQLGMAVRARDELGVNLDIISIAKMRVVNEGDPNLLIRRPERIYLPGNEVPIPMAEDDPVTHFLQRLRDETHRFAITFHRSSRAKRVFRSVLDDISGVGPERRARLLKAFGSVERLKDASPDEVAKAGRMPRSLAEKILSELNETSSG